MQKILLIVILPVVWSNIAFAGSCPSDSQPMTDRFVTESDRCEEESVLAVNKDECILSVPEEFTNTQSKVTICVYQAGAGKIYTPKASTCKVGSYFMTDRFVKSNRCEGTDTGDDEDAAALAVNKDECVLGVPTEFINTQSKVTICVYQAGAGVIFDPDRE